MGWEIGSKLNFWGETMAVIRVFGDLGEMGIMLFNVSEWIKLSRFSRECLETVDGFFSEDGVLRKRAVFFEHFIDLKLMSLI